MQTLSIVKWKKPISPISSRRGTLLGGACAIGEVMSSSGTCPVELKYSWIYIGNIGIKNMRDTPVRANTAALPRLLSLATAGRLWLCVHTRELSQREIQLTVV
jgi:hypothetical protein